MSITPKATLPMYTDLEGDEVRMLKFVEAPNSSKSHLVHCELEHVLLNDFSKEFKSFLSSTDNACNPSILGDWIKASNSMADKVSEKLISNLHISLPRWRKTMQENDEDNRCSRWGDTMNVMKANPSRYAMPDFHNHYDLSDISWSFTMPKTDPIKNQESFSFLPRFRWGDFEAISYCWESEVREKIIYLNGTLFAIPTNLEALLQRLRRLRSAKLGMRFWVDALCINQNNIAEKNHQVKLMESIYTRSFAVIVWLGEAAEESDNAIDLMAEMTRYTLCSGESWGRGGYGGPVGTEDAGQLEEQLPNMPWKALLSFLSRNYWQRLWIIQELALNHNMTLFLCGDRQLSRDIIRRACEFCMRNSTSIDRVILGHPEEQHRSFTDTSSIWNTFYQVEALITMRSQASETLDVVLDLSRRAKVTNSKDKVYGLLGLLPEALIKEISVDYQSSQEQVYAQFATSVLCASRNMDPVFSWCTFEAKASWPSWVPDWTTKFTRNHIQRLRRRNACASAPPVWSTTDDGRCLYTKGFVVDTVESTSLSPSQNLPYRTKLAATPKITGSSACRGCDAHKNELAGALLRTLIMWERQPTRPSMLEIPWIDWTVVQTTDIDEKKCPPPSPFGYEMMDIIRDPLWKSFDRFRHTNANFSIFGTTLREFFPEMTTNGQTWNEELANSHAQVSSSMRTAAISLVGRRLITSTHGYLGLAPEAVEKGDVIAIVYGCNFPVLLRTCGKMYQVIGESYIDGIMDGELMDSKNLGKYTEVELRIC